MFFMACSFNKNLETVKINAENLIYAFENNNDISIKYYKNKIIQISGMVVAKGFPKDKIPLKDASYITFGKIDHKGSPFFKGNTIVVCYFDKVVVHDLNEGEVITVQCRFKSYGSSYGEMNRIVFNRGKIITP